MDRRIKKLGLSLLLLCLALLLSACRTRTGLEPETGDGVDAVSAPAHSASSGTGEGTGAGDVPAETAPEAVDAGEAGGATRENPEAFRKEYDENAPAEITAGTEKRLQAEGEGEGSPAADPEAGNAGPRSAETAEDAARMTVPAEEAEQTGTDEDARKADSAMEYYTVLLNERSGSLFECQRLNLYWETRADRVTVAKASPEHELILASGCYDVSARLLEENLKVDDGWVVRKNPGIIVKIAGSHVLGRTEEDGALARAMIWELRAREGWDQIAAVKDDRILILSEEMLAAPHLRLAAEVLIAKCANPDLYEDVQEEEMLRLLSEEATGAPPAGVLYYKGE